MAIISKITTIIGCVIILAVFILIFFLNYTEKMRFRLDRQFSFVRSFFDRWMAIVSAVLAEVELAGPIDGSWRDAESAYQKSSHADVSIRNINAIDAIYRSVLKAVPDTAEIAALKEEKRRIEDDLRVFRDVNNEMTVAYNKRLSMPVLRRCAALLRKKNWEILG